MEASTTLHLTSQKVIRHTLNLVSARTRTTLTSPIRLDFNFSICFHTLTVLEDHRNSSTALQQRMTS